MASMTHIRSALLAALVTFGGAAIAGAQAPAQAPQRHAHAGAKAHGRFGAKAGKQLFKGIQLSAAEKANMKAVREKYAPQMKALREQAKPQLEQARALRQKGDTAALRNLRSQSTFAQRDQVKKLLEAQRNDYRAALAPEHRAQFDANVTKLHERMANRAAKAGKKRG
jgi:Spy/CpxP family protein refolding chaperone